MELQSKILYRVLGTDRSLSELSSALGVVLPHLSSSTLSKPQQDQRQMGGEWQLDFDANRKGAGYFLSQTGRLRFEPSGYIAFRALEEAHASRLIQEWDRWIRDLKNSTHSFVQEAAAATRPLTIHDLDQYYLDRVVVQRDKAILENSSKQLTEGDKELFLRLQELRRKVKGFLISKRCGDMCFLY